MLCTYMVLTILFRHITWLVDGVSREKKKGVEEAENTMVNNVNRTTDCNFVGLETKWHDRNLIRCGKYVTFLSGFETLKTKAAGGACDGGDGEQPVKHIHEADSYDIFLLIGHVTM